jgi:hypothetical protein
MKPVYIVMERCDHADDEYIVGGFDTLEKAISFVEDRVSAGSVDDLTFTYIHRVAETSLLPFPPYFNPDGNMEKWKGTVRGHEERHKSLGLRMAREKVKSLEEQLWHAKEAEKKLELAEEGE